MSLKKKSFHFCLTSVSWNDLPLSTSALLAPSAASWTIVEDECHDWGTCRSESSGDRRCQDTKGREGGTWRTITLR